MAVVCPATRLRSWHSSLETIAALRAATTLSLGRLATDRFVGLRPSAPHPTAAEELATMRTKSYSKSPDA
jgi:hypothetical protein